MLQAERIKALSDLNFLYLLVASESDSEYRKMRTELRKKVYLPYELEFMEQEEIEERERIAEENWQQFRRLFGGGKIK